MNDEGDATTGGNILHGDEIVDKTHKTGSKRYNFVENATK